MIWQYVKPTAKEQSFAQGVSDSAIIRGSDFIGRVFEIQLTMDEPYLLCKGFPFLDPRDLTSDRWSNYKKTSRPFRG